MDIFVARQPIFNVKHRVIGYELLYRQDGQVDRAGGDLAPDEMGNSLIVDAVLGIGLGQITGGETAFLNLDREMLLQGVVDVLDPKDVVLELLETVPPDEEVIAACKALKARGYRIALDDFEYSPEYVPLLELADVVKIDVLVHSGEELRRLVEQVRPHDVQLLAEKVEHSGVHEQCVEMGFELFQGFHYFRPETLSKKDLSTESVAMLRLLDMLRDMNASESAIEQAFRSDPSLSYKLLRMVNSAALGGRGIDSLGHALRVLGRDPLYRWLSLLLVAARGSQGHVQGEMVKSALVRGRFCELAGDVASGPMGVRKPGSGTLFLTGLFSHLDALMGTPMSQILAQIDLAQEVKAALLDREGMAGRILEMVEAYEVAEWEEAEEIARALGGDAEALPMQYLDALAWAGNRLGIQEELAA